MSFIALPYNLGPAKISWGFQRSVLNNESPLSSKLQRVTYGQPLWKATLQFAPVQAGSAHNFAAFYDQLSRGDAFVYVDGYVDRMGDTPTNEIYTNGVFAAPDLLTNGGFEFDTANWTGVSADLNWNARRLRVSNDAAQGRAYQSVTTTTNKPYALVADLVGDQWANSWRMAARQGGTGGTALGTARDITFTATNRGVLLVDNAETALDIVLGLGTSTDNHVAQFANATFARCLQVSAGSQVGGKLTVTGGPSSASPSVLRAGEFVTVCTSAALNDASPRYELKRLIEDFATDASGLGTIHFVPPLRNSPVLDAPIILNRAFCKMTLPKQASEGTLDGPNKHGFTMDLLEDVT